MVYFLVHFWSFLCIGFTSPCVLGNFFYFWTGLVSVSVLYNAVSIPLRFCFDIYSQSWHWLVSDYLFADLIYFLDIMLIKTHINFKFSGMKVGEDVSWVMSRACPTKVQIIGSISSCTWPAQLTPW